MSCRDICLDSKDPCAKVLSDMSRNVQNLRQNSVEAQFGSGGDFFLNRGKCEELRAIVCGTGRIVLLLTSPVGCESLRASAPEANLDCETKMSCHVATFA